MTERRRGTRRRSGCWLLAALALCAARPAAADPVDRWRPLITEASRRFGIPDDWIIRVMRAESGGRTRLGARPIRSARGAMGLMQLMPGTWADMRARLGLGSDPDDPRDNILAGTFYLRLMYDRFGYPGLFGAYNAGPARYGDHVAGRARLPAETIGYLARTAGSPVRVGVRAPVPRAELFAVRHALAAGEAPGAAPAGRALFAIVKR